MAKKPEETVKSKCLSALDQWQRWGVVIDYDDVSGLGKKMLPNGRWIMHTKKGKRDLVAWFKVGKVLWSYLIECKSPGQVQKPEQIVYESKWQGLDNVIYQVVEDYKVIHLTLDKLTGRTAKLLAEGEEHMFPTSPTVVKMRLNKSSYPGMIVRPKDIRKGIWLKKSSTTTKKTELLKDS